MPNVTREVLVIDQASVFKSEERKCRREQARLDSLRRQLEKFERIDQPAYTSWLYSTFAVEMAQLHELRQELAERFTVLHSIETEANSRNTSYEAAYARVTRRTSKKARATADRHTEESEQFEERPKRDLPSTPKPRPAAGSLKDCYRELVRRLHPDLNPQLNAHQRELWHQVQQAYQDRDLERLRQLATRAGVIDDQPQKRTTLAELRKMFRDIKQACGRLTTAIHESKSDPAWCFQETLRSPERLARIEARVIVDLAHDIENAQTALDEIEKLLAEWAAAPKTAKKTGHTKGRGRGHRR